MRYAVETRSLTKKYQSRRGFSDIFRRPETTYKTALSDISLTIEEGQVFGLLGPNGSGKTTFLKLISTILAPTSGSATVLGHDVHTDGQLVRSLISLVTGEERSFYWRLSGRRNLEFFASLYRLSKNDTDAKISELLDTFNLTDMADIRVSDYSAGMKQRLAIARGLLSSPKLLILDEPTKGLDPVSAHNLLVLIKSRLAASFDNTIILTTHIMREVEQLCRQVAVLDSGKIVYSGTVDDLRSSVQRFDRYSIAVEHLSDISISIIRQTSDVQSCLKANSDNGVTNINLVLSKDSPALSQVLELILSQRSRVIHCTKQEPSFEDIFRSLFHEGEGVDSRHAER